VRSQAAEVGRRRRAEEQVTHLKGELRAAQADASHAQRRYQELLRRIEELEQENQEKTKEEVDRQRETARAAWQTAEEEVGRLEKEVGNLQRKIEREREQNRQLERSYEQLEADHQVAVDERKRLIARLKRALKLSEQRRKAVESALSGMRDMQAAPAFGYGAGNAREVEGLDRIAVGSGAATIDVEPDAGWGETRVAGEGEISDEFLMIEADESINEAWQAAGAQDESTAEEVSDAEAEELMMSLDVERKVAQRQARKGDAGRRVSAASRAGAAASTGPADRPRNWLSPAGLPWTWITAGAAAVVAVALVTLIFI
jgi:predicted RNase H-like nuclease (RuvC/YqgF family)